MRQFASSYPDFPFVQVPLAQLLNNISWQKSLSKLRENNNDFVQVPLAQITWYHHISLISKVKNIAQRAFYIMATAQEGWSRDVMLMQIKNGYIEAKGESINNFSTTLPPIQSDLARYTFKDPYNFSFLGTVALQNELDIEKKLTEKVTDFLLEMGKGFSFVGRQYHISVDGDDYYIDILMYHLKLHCYVVVELKAVEFIPEFVSKLNFYISAVDEYVKTPEDNYRFATLPNKKRYQGKICFTWYYTTVGNCSIRDRKTIRRCCLISTSNRRIGKKIRRLIHFYPPLRAFVGKDLKARENERMRSNLQR